MATAIPPATKECLDGDAMEWLRSTGFIYVISGVPDLTAPFGPRQAWNQSMIQAHIYGPSGDIPKAAGGTYASNELVNRGDLEAWAFDTAPDYPEATEVPQSFAVGQLPPADPNPGNLLSWFNPSFANTDWLVQVSIDGGAAQTLATVNGVSSNQQAAHHGTLNQQYCYRIRYKHPDFAPVSNWTSELCRVADNP